MKTPNAKDQQPSEVPLTKTQADEFAALAALVGRCYDKILKLGVPANWGPPDYPHHLPNTPQDRLEPTLDLLIVEFNAMKYRAAATNELAEMNRRQADDIRGHLQTIEELKADGLKEHSAPRWQEGTFADDREREMRVMTGAVALPNGERIVLRNLESYAAGGDCAIVFTGVGGREIGRWQAPFNKLGNSGPATTYTPDERQKMQEKILEQFDQIFDALS